MRRQAVRAGQARALWAVAVLGCIAVLQACAPTGAGRLLPTEPSPTWEERLLEARGEKDRLFREDPETPLLARDVEDFEGLDYWPPDPGYHLAGPIHFYGQPERFTIVTTGGEFRPCERVGWLSFVLQGQVWDLQVYRLLDLEPGESEALFLPFADATSGHETYPAGRYLDLAPTESGRYVLDFNRAYNPSCAYGAPERFACPVTPEANRLPLRIEAGERGYRESGGEG